MAEPIADLLAVTFTAVLFGIQFKKILGSIKKNTGEKNSKMTGGGKKPDCLKQDRSRSIRIMICPVSL